MKTQRKSVSYFCAEAHAKIFDHLIMDAFPYPIARSAYDSLYGNFQANGMDNKPRMINGSESILYEKCMRLEA